MRRPFLLAAILVLAAPVSAQDPAPEGFTFDLETLGGRRIRAEDYRDNVLIVDLWGTWCGPCRRSIPALVDLHRRYVHHGLEIVGLNYREGEGAEAEAKVRRFAVDNGVTYPLAMGTRAVREQIPDFEGYPTMLLFARGLEHVRTKTGYREGDAAEIEAWVRGALGLGEGGAEVSAGGEASEPEETGEEEAAGDPGDVPEGVIYRPGARDRGLAFEVEDSGGKTVRFADLRGRPVVLTLTSTWDREAVATATFLQELRGRFGDEAEVLAACLEIEKEQEGKVAAIRAFKKEHGVAFRFLPVGIDFSRKIHRFAGLPLHLVFDADGVLVCRAAGNSDENRKEVREALREAIAAAGGR